MILLLLLLIFFFPSTTNNADAQLYSLCYELGGEYTSNSTFQSNLDHLLTSLSLTSTSSAFNTTTHGSSPDLIYGLFLCRGDVGPTDCHVCVRNATRYAPMLCPNYKQVTLFYESCQLRYSNTSFFSVLDVLDWWSHTYNQSSDLAGDYLSTFGESENILMNNLSYQAAYKSSGLEFATGEIGYSEDDEQVIFGMVECTRDLKMDDCHHCLQKLLSGYWSCCENYTYGGVLAKSCNFRYDVQKFFDGEPTVRINQSSSSSSSSSSAPGPSPTSVTTPPPASTLAGGDNGKGHKTAIIISVMVILVVVFVLILASCIYFRRRSTTQSTQSMAGPEVVSTTVTESLYYDLFILKVATSNFSEANKLGQGGFGKVYKGILPNGEIVAVKRLSASSKQGIGELKNELLLVAKLQHRNLVRLRGVCLEGGERLLVYEFLTNGSLDMFLSAYYTRSC